MNFCHVRIVDGFTSEMAHGSDISLVFYLGVYFPLVAFYM